MEQIKTIIMSILFGMIPETLFFTLFLIYTKNIKEKKLKLFISIIFIYILCIFIQRYKIIYYVLFIILFYIILKILYKRKTQIIDIFIIAIMYSYLTIISIICFAFAKENFTNYYILMFINRFLLILPFIFKNEFNVLYKKYCNLWNRNDKIDRPIKSITLRNISLILLNLLIFIVNILCIHINEII